MLTCKEITQLVSESLDRPLPLRKRVSVWMHLSMCRLCSAFRRDQLVLKERISDELERASREKMSEEVKLSAAAKQRMKKELSKR
ncbi:anti-sigma factor family protein [Neorhodopirellula lusitana]